MRLAELAVNPFRVSTRALSESFYQALNPVAAQARCGGCASPQCGANQIGIFGTKADATVSHEAYDPIVPLGCQGQILVVSGFGFRDTGPRIA